MKIPTNKLKNKKAVSEIVSYVLLIVIAMSIAAGVYSWLRFYVGGEEMEKCPEDIALSVNDYSCSISEKILNMDIENKGYFNIEGFFIRASSQPDKIPVTFLNSTDESMVQAFGPGRYQFDFPSGKSPLKSGEIKTLNFSYGSLDSIKRIQVQPFVSSSKADRLLLCGIIDINVNGC